MAATGKEILNVIMNHPCTIRDRENAASWPEYKALVARIKANEEDCQEEDDDGTQDTRPA